MSSQTRKKRTSHHRKWKLKKKTIINLWSILSAVIIVGLLIYIGQLLATDMPKDNGENGDISENVAGSKSEFLQIHIPVFEREVFLIGGAAQAYLSASYDVPASAIIESYREGGSHQDIGLPVRLKFEIPAAPAGLQIQSVEVDISENSGFEEAKTYTIADKYQLDVYNLKTGVQYYYRIRIQTSNGTTSSVQGTFFTAETPRFFNISGIKNVRDIGGWETVDGKKIRQGLLIRGSELDGVVEAEYRLTSNGIHTMLNELKIRTEMDLRFAPENADVKDVLGIDVEHRYYPVVAYESAIKESYGQAAIRSVFSDLANPNRYPVYMHCTYGADRTGTVCYLLEALLGVPEEDLIREYELTSMCYNIRDRKELQGMIQALQTYDGETMQEKAQNYLLSIGVTPEEIQSIKQIFLEE